MTKAKNRVAAKAYHQERIRELDERAKAERVKADLAELRRGLISGVQARLRRGDREKLMNAIDDYVEQLTGDRTKLHARSSSIG